MSVLELPTELPVNSLSVSSIRLFLSCPQRWKYRYIDNVWEPTSGPAVLGSAVGAAEAENYVQKILSGQDLDAQDVLDAFSDEFEERSEREDVDWAEHKPGDLKDAGAKLLALYHRTIAPRVNPTHVERQFVLRFPGVGWSFKGYLDVEDEDGAVLDVKVKGKAISQKDADGDLQATSYLLARRAEGNPASEFRFHGMTRVKSPEPKHAYVLPTTRTDRQLDLFLLRLTGIAKQIAWRAEFDEWEGAAPGSWMCSEKWCGHFAECVYGGAQ